MKKTESERIQLTNHEKNMLRKLARSFGQVEKAIVARLNGEAA